MLSVLDSALFEEMDQVTQPDAVPNDSTSNLLSSGIRYVLLCSPVNTSKRYNTLFTLIFYHIKLVLATHWIFISLVIQIRQNSSSYNVS